MFSENNPASRRTKFFPDMLFTGTKKGTRSAIIIIPTLPAVTRLLDALDLQTGLLCHSLILWARLIACSRAYRVQVCVSQVVVPLVIALASQHLIVSRYAVAVCPWQCSVSRGHQFIRDNHGYFGCRVPLCVTCERGEIPRNKLEIVFQYLVGLCKSFEMKCASGGNGQTPMAMGHR